MSANEFSFGQRVKVYPMPGLRVVDGPGGAALPTAGREVMWSEFWHARHRDGSISLTDPNPKQPVFTVDASASDTTDKE